MVLSTLIKMVLKKLYRPGIGRMRVAGFMSGSGSNLRKIIEYSNEMGDWLGGFPYQVVVIFSDNEDSNASQIGKEFDIPVVIRDIGGFYKRRGRPKKDLSIRSDFDRETIRCLEPFEVDVAAFAGYMSIATDPLIDEFLGVNVHPADLSVMDGLRRKYIGDNAVRDAILDGVEEIRASTHVIEKKVDYGRILIVSSPLFVRFPEDFDLTDRHQVNEVSIYHQNLLKEVGDNIILPKTLEYLASGRYSEDENCNLYFDDKLIPNGVRID
jgi:folate-dependent phosphoribosylglycinamide formyltransferase PurN